MKDDQRVAITKRLLSEGLFRLLEKKEIGKIKVSELCAESGINRATFYRHYEQPRDILKELRRGMIKDVQLIGEKNTGQRDLYRWLEDICCYFRDKSDVLRVLFKTRTEDEFVEVIQEAYSLYFGRYKESVGGQADEEELMLTTYCYAGGFYYVLRQWILGPADKSPQEIASVMYNFLTGNRVLSQFEKIK